MSRPGPLKSAKPAPCSVVVIWIDWYAYHVARFRGLLSHPALQGRVAGIEMVSGEGVHAGLRFREDLPADLPVSTLAPGAGWRTVLPLRLSWLLWKRLTQLDPAAVLVPGYYTLPAVAAALWARTHERRSILMTESTELDHRRVWWRESIKRVLLHGLFDSAVAGGTAHRRYLHQLGFTSEPIAGCYDVVDNTAMAERVDVLRRERAPLNLQLPESPFFLYVGRLAPEKNVSLLLDAWVQYRSDGGSWPLVLVGDGSERSRLFRQVRGSSFSQGVLFAGHQPAKDLAPFYAYAGCFVLPSTREPWGLVVNEAMAAGLPVLVSSRCGATEDLVRDGCNGFHFDPWDVSQLRRLLRRIEQLSTADREQMADASRSLIQAYSPQCFGSEIASLLSK